MSILGIFQSELVKTKRTAFRRISVAVPLCLSVLVLIQGKYYSQNLFNWFYIIFLPATFALISAAAVNIDNRKHGLRAVRLLPLSQYSIWRSKLLIATLFGLGSCMVLGVAEIAGPAFLSLFGFSQFKQYSVGAIFLGVIVMFSTTVWQMPLCFILAKRLGLVFAAIVNLFVSFSGVSLAMTPYWFLCPWAWVSHSMVPVIGVLPNGLPAEGANHVGSYDVLLAVALSLVLASALGVLATSLFARSEAR